MAKRLNLAHGRLLIAKALKVLGIRMGFIWPTLRVKLLLRWYGCPYGPGLQACGPIHVRSHTPGAIRLGRNVALTARFLTNTLGISQPVMLETLGSGRIDIGHHSGLTAAILSARTQIRIGDYVKIGGNVRLYDHDFHSRDFQQRRHGALDAQHVATAAIEIGDDVLIGANAIILKGVRIGPRSIIGAGSVVTRLDIPADSLVAGNPARIVRSLTNSPHV